MNAIVLNNISKKYTIVRNKHKATLASELSNRFKLPFSFSNNQNAAEEFWALKNVNLKIKKGDSIGIIGKNGSGKSTLLKIIAGIITPTAGSVLTSSTPSTLFKVDTGFHPDFTGRENIIFSGGIINPTKKITEHEINEIIAFSGIDQFIDVPVKYYSSGMYLRLAFAVTTMLCTSNILLIDEVLAVGDKDFYEKCLKKIKSLMEKGVTIVLVSHNLNEIKKNCQNCVWMHKGVIKKIGKSQEIVQEYETSE